MIRAERLLVSSIFVEKIDHCLDRVTVIMQLTSLNAFSHPSKGHLFGFSPV